MTSLKLIGAAMIAASALASPAMGQASISNPAACESMFASANCLNAGAGSPYATSRQERQYRRTAYRDQNRNNVNRQDNGFWPAATAGAVAGAAVGTAAAVASAPFRGWDNSYAYDTSGGYNGGRGELGWYGNWDTYAARNGIVCRPGTWYKGADGLQHICQ